MTDTDTSGASLAPVADTSAPAASAETLAGTFGITRGSGLARGKRTSSAAAPTATQVKSDYKPTTIEVITPAREYKNPFASQEAATVPASEPAISETPAAPVAAAEPEVHATPAAPMFSAEPEAENPEINILPPAEAVRPAVSWETPSAERHDEQNGRSERPRRDERPTFRADRREDAVGGPQAEVREPRRDSFQRQPRDPREARQPRDPREARQPRDPRDERQPRDPRDERQPRDPREARQPRDPRDERPARDQNGNREHTASKAASGGFFGWLKSLFGGQKPAEAPSSREFGERQGDGQRHRRRRRGGRGHGGTSQAFGGERQSHGGGPRAEGFQGGDRDNRGGERHGSHGRRRHRSGEGRGRGGDPRPEGQQGGGAI